MALLFQAARDANPLPTSVLRFVKKLNFNWNRSIVTSTSGRNEIKLDQILKGRLSYEENFPLNSAKVFTWSIRQSAPHNLFSDSSYNSNLVSMPRSPRVLFLLRLSISSLHLDKHWVHRKKLHDLIDNVSGNLSLCLVTVPWTHTGNLDIKHHTPRH